MPNMSLSDTPNIGTVVNRGQGFTVEVTIDNSAGTDLWDLNDGKLILQTVQTGGVDSSSDLMPISPGVSVAEGGQFSIDIPKIASGSVEKVNFAFETDIASTALANYDIEIKYQGYVGQNENILIFVGPPQILVENTAGPTWDDTATISVQIHQE